MESKIRIPTTCAKFMGMIPLLLFLLLSGLQPMASAATPLQCLDLFQQTELPKINWYDIENVETAGSNSDIGFMDGWVRPEIEGTNYGIGLYHGKKVFFKIKDSNHPNELSILRELNQSGLGPQVLATFRKFHSDWFMTEFLEGRLFRLDYKYGNILKDGSGYAVNPYNRPLAKLVNQTTVNEVQALFQFFNEHSIAAHDFQFLVTPEGHVNLIDVGHYERTPNAVEINQKILQIVIDDLNILLNRGNYKAPYEARVI